MNQRVVPRVPRGLTWPCACGPGGPSPPPRSRTRCGSCPSSERPLRSWPGIGPWSCWWSSLQDATSRALSTQDAHTASTPSPTQSAALGANGPSLVGFHLAPARHHDPKESQIPRTTPSLNAPRFVFSLLGLRAGPDLMRSPQNSNV